MKWLFLFLLSINAVIFIYQTKSAGMHNINVGYVAEPGVKNINLLGELEGGVVRERCVVIGAIDSRAALGELKGHLDAQQIVYEIIDKKLEMAPSYWVFASGGEGQDLVDRLKSIGVDSYKVAEGEWAGKVSLGLFANIDLAQNLIDSLKVKGFEASYIERKKYKESLWVSFKLDETMGLDALASEIKAKNINVGEIKEFFCKSIASEK